MRLAVLALTLALALPARAEDAAPDPAAAADAASAAAAGLALPAPPAPPDAAPGAPPAAPGAPGAFARFGLLLDAGFPEGAAASLVFRPVPAVRLHAGPAWSGVAFGVQGGVTLVPWHVGVSPLLSLEAGRYFAADATFLAHDASGVPEELSPLLDDVAYDYAAAHVGLEIGTKNAFALSLRAGLSYVSFVATGRVAVTDAGTGTTVVFVDPRVRGTLPSVKLGLQLWF